MCGRYVSPTQAEMERYWDLTQAQIRNPLAQAFNVSPTATVPMLWAGTDGLELVAARWGLIPFWWKESKPPGHCFNARSEEAPTKPMWRHAAAKARCLVPAVGWYEWREVERVNPTTGEVMKAKQPYLIQRHDKALVVFAGLMSQRTAEDGSSVFSCSILTRDAVGTAADIHTRMPIALSKESESSWLDPSLTDAVKAIQFAINQSDADFAYRMVNPRVNNSRSEGAELIEPFEIPA
jgi:putative SOS response-associated peptidase YedK